jgi:hypothetical protein
MLPHSRASSKGRSGLIHSSLTGPTHLSDLRKYQKIPGSHCRSLLLALWLWGPKWGNSKVPKDYGGVNRGISLHTIGIGSHKCPLHPFSCDHNWASHPIAPWELLDRHPTAQGTHFRLPVLATLLMRGGPQPQSPSSFLVKSRVHWGKSP